jgi:hypothetical protein
LATVRARRPAAVEGERRVETSQYTPTDRLVLAPSDLDSILTVDLPLLSLDAAEDAALEHLQAADAETLGPADLLARLGGVLPDVSGSGVEENTDDEQVEETFGDLEGVEGRVGLPGVDDRAEEVRRGRGAEVAPSGVAGDLRVESGSLSAQSRCTTGTTPAKVRSTGAASVDLGARDEPRGWTYRAVVSPIVPLCTRKIEPDQLELSSF